MQGNISPLALAAVFRQIARHRQSGTLLLSSGERSAEIRFSEGSVADALVNESGRTPTLVEKGSVDSDGMREKVIERARESLLEVFGSAIRGS